MNIVSPRIEELAQRLARLAVSSAEDRRAAPQEFFDLAARMPVRDARSIDEIIGYGPDGLPS